MGEYLAWSRMYEPRELGGRVVYLVTGNCCFRRAVLDEVGGFEEAIVRPGGGEDVELCFRLLARGYDLARIPLSVRALDRRTLGTFVRTCYRYGRGLRDIRRRCDGAFWTSPPTRLVRALEVLGCPLTLGITAARFVGQGRSVRESCALSGLRYLHLCAYALGYCAS